MSAKWKYSKYSIAYSILSDKVYQKLSTGKVNADHVITAAPITFMLGKMCIEGALMSKYCNVAARFMWYK